MHPWTLHATTALWSVRRSTAALHQCIASAALDAADGLHGQTYGSRHAVGGHGDGITTGLAQLGQAAHWRHVDARAREHITQACWLARSDTGQPRDGRDLHAYLADALPAANPATARDIADHLTAADAAIRRTLRVGPDHWPLPANPPCPTCGVRMLRAVTSAPASRDWTVVCTAGCRCAGNDCPCGMDQPTDRVPHIWPATAPLVAAQLATLPRRRIRRRVAA